MAGFALAESARPGANIFSLYDTCRIVIAGGSRSPDRETTRMALYGAVNAHYRQRGIKNFVLLVAEGDDGGPGGGRVTFEAQAVRIAFSARLVPFWAAHLDQRWSVGCPFSLVAVGPDV
jgi:hypothetical protein